MTIPAKRLLPPSPHRHALAHKNERDPAFTLQDEITWTFGTGEKPVNVVVSLIGALVVLAQAGWLVQGVSSGVRGIGWYSPRCGADEILVFIASQALKIASNKGGDRASGNGNLFLGTLIGLELLTVKYWVNGRIYTVSVTRPAILRSLVGDIIAISFGTDAFAAHLVPTSLLGSRLGLGLYRQERVTRYPAQAC